MAQARVPFLSSALIAGALAFAGPANAEFDRSALKAQGEVFLVAVHDTFKDAAGECAAQGDEPCETFFQTRADAIADGAELYTLPLPPSAVANPQDPEQFGEEYHETHALITSEAADRAPYEVAQVQAAYEGWVNAAYQRDDAATAAWHARWLQAMDAMGAGADPDAPDAPWLVSFIAR